MKAVEEKIVEDIINNEDKVELNMSVSDFDISVAEIDSAEDIDAKLIGYVEKEIRNSYEYRTYIQYLKDELDLTRCALLPNIDIKTTPVSLEFHHFPFTLYDITEVIAKSMVGKAGSKTVSCFDIAGEVILEHFKNNIGLVPLTETLHQMAHNNAIIVPITKVNGNYKEFIRKYKPFIEHDKLDKITMMEAYNDSEDAQQYNDSKLRKRIVNYNIEYRKKEKEDEDNV